MDEKQPRPMVEQQTKLYKIRWVYMAANVLMQMGQMMLFVVYGPVASSCDGYYGHGTNNAVSLIYMLTAGLGALPAMWLNQARYGNLILMYTGATTSFLGALLRLISSIDAIDDVDTRRLIVLIGTFIGAVGNPCIVILPPRIAGVWFGDNERAMCTSVIAIAGPLGIMLVSIFGPMLAQDFTGIPNLNIFVFAFCAAAFVFMVAFIHKERPLIPPSAGSIEEGAQTSFWKGVGECLSTFQFWLLALIIGAGIGVFNIMFVEMESILCVQGYSYGVSSGAVAAIIIAGMTGSVVTGVYSDRSHHLVEAMKICFPFVSISLAFFLIVTTYSGIPALVIIVSAMFGFFGLGVYGIALELGAEITYPIMESTSAGLLGLWGQVSGVILMVVFALPQTHIDGDEWMVETCTDHGIDINSVYDTTIPLIVVNMIALVYMAIAMLVFNPQYKRMWAEAEKMALRHRAPTDNQLNDVD